MAMTGAAVSFSGTVPLKAAGWAAHISGCMMGVGTRSGAAAWLSNGCGSGWSDGRRTIVGWRSVVRWPNVGCFECICHLDAGYQPDV
jgi:hypothetical protein